MAAFPVAIARFRAFRKGEYPGLPSHPVVKSQGRDVADDGESTAHVAVECTISDGEFALVAGGEHARSPFVGESHESHAAQARLQVLFGDVRFRALEDGGQGLHHRLIAVVEGDEFEADTEALGHVAGVVH